MTRLTPSDFVAEITWTGVVPDRAVSLAANPVDVLELGFDGAAGDCHGGATRPSCSRVIKQYPQRGTEIRNARQLSILSVEEMAATAHDMGISMLEPAWVGANLVIEGIPDFTQVPPASRLVAEDGTASIAIDMENGPCRFPADLIETHHPGLGRGWTKAAMGRRGVVAWVERPGALKVGDRLRLHLPPAMGWAHY
ncbi:MOSC domain-containing protein [Rhodovulum sp. DZ06]|uniref:MOSC domain-containing protein n=1 Tax=Rhodovulum sp. DZ06 TaxID=3425126 RepID=UPI003D32F036